ncbi:hypothetical protein B0T14DRAFT_207985 [Immersiella caudata]|uniref:Uncharacterized protein n=1 Tax=Immersiella caudata TaxID=314043 RepID=A0AA39WPY1_9PEZI|nr:hypothetical protein B0T14DRAFT_207985 [Immersiella caudata]
METASTCRSQALIRNGKGCEMMLRHDDAQICLIGMTQKIANHLASRDLDQVHTEQYQDERIRNSPRSRFFASRAKKFLSLTREPGVPINQAQALPVSPPSPANLLPVSTHNHPHRNHHLHLPIATENSGTSLVTTLPAPIVHPFPIFTPGIIDTFPPIQQSSPISTSTAYSNPSRRLCTPTSCVAVKIDTPGPINTRFPIFTSAQSSITRPKLA